ncbi:hypothetical protein Daura_29525 [Dactylosporangium aurantiacum]|uniref:Uncharacterized protein n=1 Tax=Dactylosporangium aurantiacum TaxID=35754 RepID=A0A9Q9ME25_9ACTN|nr:hypothetical protein [Dactylosporangium aurantiacum]MDG6106793.1 hypothetical protein [Dactylosporangium aurantiacum]UWZ50935.1 hypothetical protein Daura_29525 [Dactylosporangium aurantiacum]
MTELERRYARWTALFYPAGYRRERGSELVDTYLSLAAPDRTRPSAADVADLAVGGLRQHLRVAQDLGAGFRLAGVLALATLAAFATGWAIFEAVVPWAPWFPHRGPFLSSLGVPVWAAWLLAVVVHVVAPGRWFRWAIGLAVLVTAGVVPAAMLPGVHRPPLFVLLPQLVLGVVALGAAGRQPRRVRLMPLAAAAVSVPVAASTAPRFVFSGDFYYEAAPTALPAAAVTLLIGGALLAFGLAARHDHRGAWALLILLTPIGMLALHPLSAMLDDSSAGRSIIPVWSHMVTAAMLVLTLGLVSMPLAIAARGRLSSRGRPVHTAAGRCPTCGAPSAST